MTNERKKDKPKPAHGELSDSFVHLDDIEEAALLVFMMNAVRSKTTCPGCIVRLICKQMAAVIGMFYDAVVSGAFEEADIELTGVEPEATFLAILEELKDEYALQIKARRMLSPDMLERLQSEGGMFRFTDEGDIEAVSDEQNESGDKSSSLH